MESSLIIIIIAAIIQLFIIYFVIQGATKANENIKQNNKIINLLQLIAIKNGASNIDFFNAQYIFKVKPIEGDKENENVLVETKWLNYYIGCFKEDATQRIRAAVDAKEPTMIFNLRELNEAMAK